MNKSAIAVLATLGIAVAGALGGYIYAERAVAREIDTFFAQASDMKGIQSASYDTMDVSLIGDTVSLTGLEVQVDPQILASPPPNADTAMAGHLDGRVTHSAKTVLVTGVRGLLLGDPVLDTVTLTAPRIDTDLKNTVENAMGEPQSLRFTGEVAGARLRIEGLDTTPFMTTPVDVGALNIARIQLDTLVLDASMGPTAADGTMARRQAQMIQKIAQVHLDEISAERIGGAELTDVRLDVRFPDGPFPGLSLTAASADMGETVYVDDVPVKTSNTITELVIEREGVPTFPQIAALRDFLGVEDIAMDVSVAYDINPETGRGTIGPIALTVHQGGRVNATFDMSALPDLAELDRLQTLAQTDPQARAEVQNMVGQAALNEASILYEDRGGLRKFVAQQAQKHTNGDVAMVADALARQGAGLVSLSHGPDVAGRVHETLKTYLTDPGVLRVDLTSATPVKIAELAVGFQVAGPLALGAMDLNVSLPEPP